MEFFIPGLAVLLLIAIIVFLVLPRIGAPILAILSLILLAYGLNNHMSMFYSEYRNSTWQDTLKVYAPFVIVGGLLLAVLGYMGFLFTTGSQSSLPASNIPAIAGVMNATKTNAPNGIANAVVNTVGNVVNKVGNVVGNAVNKVGNAVGIANKNRGLANLGGILKTPTNRP